jgi:NADH-quinone oxidoreductase subunit M
MLITDNEWGRSDPTDARYKQHQATTKWNEKHGAYLFFADASGNVLYVGWVAMKQKNLNLLIGNSSVAHMGFIFLGIASLSLVGVTGAVVLMIAHGLLAALTFGLTGYLYQQTKTLDMTQMGGLLQRLPFVGTVMIMAMLAGCGLPGFANFVGEAMVFFGAWNAFPLVTVLAVTSERCQLWSHPGAHIGNLPYRPACSVPSASS